MAKGQRTWHLWGERERERKKLCEKKRKLKKKER